VPVKRSPLPHQEVLLMLAAKTARRQAHCLRWKSPPWDEHHTDWIRLDNDLPKDHVARLIDRAVDLLDLQPYMSTFCAGFGSESWHPAVLLKLVLYEMNRKVHSAAEWFRDCSELIPLRWLLKGARPSRATLYQCRQRLTPRLIKRLNRQVLLAARAEEHCPARRASLDGTFTAARASRHHLLNRKRLDKRLAVLEQAVADDEATANDLGGVVQIRPPRWLASSPHGRKQQLARYRQARLRLLAKMARHEQRQSSRGKSRRQPVERVVISPREPEAAVGKDKSKVVRPLYDVQFVRDLDSPFLLGYGVFATNSDSGLLPKMLVQTKALCGVVPEELLADSIYASVRDLRVCQRRGVTLYAPLQGEKPQRKLAEAVAADESARRPLPLLPSEGQPPQAAEATKQPEHPKQGKQPKQPKQSKQSKEVEKLYGKEQFVWEESSRSYLCPAGQRLQRVTRARVPRVHGGSVAVEKYGTKACSGCVQRGQCTKSKRGRQIKRLADEPLVEKLRQRMRSASGKELYRLRKQTIEREFADAAEHRGLRRFWGFGLLLAQIQVGLLVLLHNLKALLQPRQTATTPAA
jgi:transposase